MFLASAPSPEKSITKEKAIENFSHLLARTCEFLKELENLGKIKKGCYMPLYEKIRDDAKTTIEDGWNV